MCLNAKNWKQEEYLNIIFEPECALFCTLLPMQIQVQYIKITLKNKTKKGFFLTGKKQSFYALFPCFRTTEKDNMSPAAFSVCLHLFYNRLTSFFFFSFFSFFFLFLCTKNQRYLSFCFVFLVQQWIWINLIKRWRVRLFRKEKD